MQAREAHDTTHLLLLQDNSYLDPSCLFIEHGSDVGKAKAHTTSYCLATIAAIE